MSASANERLAAARTAVDTACHLLLSPTPEQMDGCAHLLESAVTELRAFRTSIAASQHIDGKTEALNETRSLQSSIGRVKQLLENAGAFYANWIRCLAALCGGYTDRGQPAPLERGGRFLVQG